MRYALIVGLALGCAHLPDGVRAPSKSEARAIDLAVETWTVTREPAPCDVLDRAMVAVVPYDELQTWCYSEVALGCVLTVQRYVGEAPRALILVSDTLDESGVAAVVIHESLHIMRACWVYDAREDFVEYASRMDRGETATCQIHTRADHWHCDSEIWTGIEFEAFNTWSTQ